MKTFYLYFLLSFLTGNFITPLIILFIAYLIFDRMFFGLTAQYIIEPIRRKKRIKTLTTELQLNKSNANSALELGMLYYESRKYLKSLEYLNKAKVRIDNSARLHAYMGMSLMGLKQYETARNELLKALEIDKSVLYGLPYIYLLQNELSKEQINENEVCAIEKSLEKFANTENYYRMGRIYRKYGNGQKALDAFNHAIREYSFVQRKFRRTHRRWAFLSRFYKSFALSVAIVIVAAIAVISGFISIIFFG